MNFNLNMSISLTWKGSRFCKISPSFILLLTTGCWVWTVTLVQRPIILNQLIFLSILCIESMSSHIWNCLKIIVWVNNSLYWRLCYLVASWINILSIHIISRALPIFNIFLSNTRTIRNLFNIELHFVCIIKIVLG